MKFIVYGLNHTTAPLSVREKYALPPEEARLFLEKLKPLASEAVFLSTCNRVEFYIAATRIEDVLQEIRKNLSRFHALKAADAKKYFYLFEDANTFIFLRTLKLSAIYSAWRVPSIRWCWGNPRFWDR
jgi:glutamyl-tRNA reductase